jgi:hypothetical protein
MGVSVEITRPSKFVVPFHQEIIDQEIGAECEGGCSQKDDRKELNKGHT